MQKRYFSGGGGIKALSYYWIDGGLVSIEATNRRPSHLLSGLQGHWAMKHSVPPRSLLHRPILSSETVAPMVEYLVFDNIIVIINIF